VRLTSCASTGVYCRPCRGFALHLPTNFFCAHPNISICFDRREFLAHINRLETVDQVLAQLLKWFEGNNEVHPPQNLKMRSPREYRKFLIAASGCPV